MGRSPHSAETPSNRMILPKMSSRAQLRFPSVFFRANHWERFRAIHTPSGARGRGDGRDLCLNASGHARPWPVWMPASRRCRSTARTPPRPSRARRRRRTARRARRSFPRTTRCGSSTRPTRTRSTPRPTRCVARSRPPTSPTPCPWAASAPRPALRARTRSPVPRTTRRPTALYVFSRNCCTATGLDPAVFRLERDLAGRLPSRVVPVAPRGHRPEGRGLPPGTGLYFGKGAKINSYDYDTNTIGVVDHAPRRRRRGAGHDLLGRRCAPVRDLVRRRGLARLRTASSSTGSTRPTGPIDPRWTFDLTPYGVLDPRAVEVSQRPDLRLRRRHAQRRATRCVVRCSCSTCPTSRCSPRPAFSATPTSGSFPLPVQFTDQSAGGPRAGPGTSATARPRTSRAPRTPTPTAGTFTVSLTVSNTKGSDTSTMTDLVTVAAHTPIAVVHRDADHRHGAAHRRLHRHQRQRTPRAGRGTSVTAATSTAQNPSHSYTTAGTYAVSLTATQQRWLQHPSALGPRARRDRTGHGDRRGRHLRAVGLEQLELRHPDHDPGSQVRQWVKAITYQPYVRFTVPALPATPASATLRLYVTDASTATGGAVRHREHHLVRDHDHVEQPPVHDGRADRGEQVRSARPVGRVRRVGPGHRGRQLRLHADQRELRHRRPSRAVRAPTRRSWSSRSRTRRRRRVCRTRRTSGSG